MRRAFTVNLAITLAANVLVKPAYIFGVEIGIQNAVGTVAYGRLGYWISLAVLFASLLDLGLQNYTAVALARKPESVREHLPASLSLKLLVTPLYAVAVLATAALLGAGREEFGLIAWVLLTQAGLSTWQMLRNNLSAQEKYRTNSLVSVIDKAVLVLVVGTILLSPIWREWITIERFAMFQALSAAVAIGVTIMATDLAPGQRWLSWDRKALRTLLWASLPFAWTLLLNTLSSRVDILMLQWTRADGDYQVGVYSAAYRLLEAINMVAFLFATLLIPMLSAQIERGEDAGALLRQGVRYMLALTVGAAVFVSFHAQPICDALFGEATQAWGPVLAALIWSAVPTGLLYVVGSHLLALRRLRALNWIFAGAILGNIALNLTLIPWYGALGAAVATAITQALVVFAETRISLSSQSKQSRWVGFVPLLAQATSFALGSVAIAYLSAWLGLGVLWALGLQLLGCAVLALATGLVLDPRELMRVLRARA